jgi:hypothetical protein
MVGAIVLKGVFFLSLCFVGNKGTPLGDPFDDTHGQDVLGVPVVDLILGGRGSAVQRKNNHEKASKNHNGAAG